MAISRRLIPAFIAMLLLACSDASLENTVSGEEESTRLLQAGPWRGVIEIQGRKLPFQMEIAYPARAVTPRVEFINGEERVPVEELSLIHI